MNIIFQYLYVNKSVCAMEVVHCTIALEKYISSYKNIMYLYDCTYHRLNLNCVLLRQQTKKKQCRKLRVQNE